MWTLVGPFDGKTLNETSFESKLISTITSTTTHFARLEAKYLKPGCTYMLGRKERDIVINHKKVSRDHLQFQIGEFIEADAVCSTYVALCTDS